jgi:hypothetical protein
MEGNNTIIDRLVNDDPKTQELEHKLILDFTREVEKPPTLLNIIDSAGNECEIATAGNFSMITGKAKSRKSFFLGSMLVASIRGDCSMSNIKGDPDCKPCSILFDTEMSEYHSHRMGMSVIRQLPFELRENYKHFMLRELTPSDRLDFIEKMIVKYHEHVSLVVIDGIKDLLSLGINDEPESVQLVSKLMRWTSQYNIHICCVLHQNKNDKNPRGHIGTELGNKSETVIQVEKDPREASKSIITPLFTRGMDFEPFAFELDEEHFAPVTTELNIPKTKAEQKMEQMFIQLFAFKSNYNYSSLVDAIVANEKKSVAAAKKNITTGLTRGIIKKNNLFYQLAIQVEKPEDKNNNKEDDNNEPF